MTAKVLVVDDSTMVRRQVQATLVEAGFGVVEAVDGADALVKLGHSGDMSLIVLDINMPNMNGLELLEELRHREKLAAVPVVMLTTEGQPELMKQAKDLGAKGWIIKPFKPALLVRAVQRLTAGPTPRR